MRSISLITQTLPIAAQQHLAAQGWVPYWRQGSWRVDIRDDETPDSQVLATVADFDPLPTEKKVAKNRIDEAAGQARLQYITSAPGQGSVYLLKLQEATGYKAAGYPADTTSYPFIQAEADTAGVTPRQACDGVLAIAAQWVQIAATIERIRRGAKFAITQVTDWQQIQPIVANAIAQLEAI